MSFREKAANKVGIFDVVTLIIFPCLSLSFHNRVCVLTICFRIFTTADATTPASVENEAGWLAYFLSSLSRAALALGSTEAAALFKMSRSTFSSRVGARLRAIFEAHSHERPALARPVPRRLPVVTIRYD